MSINKYSKELYQNNSDYRNKEKAIQICVWAGPAMSSQFYKNNKRWMNLNCKVKGM